MKDWLYFFLDALGRSFFYQEGEQQIGSTNTQAPVRHAPDGWEDIAVGYERDMKDHGMMRSFSFPLKAVYDSARILRELIYKGGLEQEIYLLITRATVEMSDTVFKHYHKLWYRGRVDTTSIVDEEDYVTFKVEDGGLAKQLKANRGTKYDIPLDVPGHELVHLDGISLAQTNNFQINAIKSLGGTHLIDCGQTSYEGRAWGFAGHQVFGNVPIPADLTKSDDYLFNTVIPISGIHLKGEIKLVRPTFYGAELRSNKGNKIVLVPWNPGAGVKDSWSFDVTFAAAADEKFFLVGYSPDLMIEYAESHFVITFESQAPGSLVRALPLHVCLDLILEKITGKRGQYSSQLLTTSPYNRLFITSGDGLRGLDKAGLKISFNEWFEYVRIIARAGFGIEGEKVVVEDLLYFYRRSGAIQLGVANALKTTPAKELLGNTVRIGYKTPEIEGVNGKYAFNCSHLYEINPKAEAEVKELNYVAGCITDPYAVEITRINFDGKKTTDGTFDNEHFILHLKKADAVQGDVKLNAGTNATQYMLNTVGTIQWPVHLSTPTGAFLKEDSNRKFRYNLPTPMIFTIAVRVLWDVGKQATMKLYVNGTVAAQQSAVGDGANAVAIDFTRAFQQGDQIWVEIEHTEANAVTFGLLTVQSVGVARWVLYRETYTELDGLPEKAKQTVFNIELLTPKRLLRLHAPWLNGAFYKMWDRQAVYHFVSTDRNRELRTRLVNAVMDYTVDEDGDDPITEDIVYKPWFFEFEVSAPSDMVEVMQANPYRPYLFTWNDKPFIGYLIRGGIAPDDDKPMVFRLLCTPDTDLLPLLNN